MKKFISCILLSAMICGCFASCGDKTEDSSSESAPETTTQGVVDINVPAETDPNATEVPTAVAVEEVDFEDAVVANPGDAYLAIVDGQWWIQYWGKDDTMLTYNAGVTPITGNGDYTVSVTADTNGFRFDTTGDAADDSCIPGGLSFMALMIPDGENLFPGAILTVNSIKVDGKEIEMKSKPYTSSDDGIETRANLYNGYVNKPSEDARTIDGNLYDENGNALEACEQYSPQVVSLDDFAEWKTVEVNFTVSGIAE